MIRISMGYPSISAETAMIDARKNGVNPLDDVKSVCDIETILKMQSEVNEVFIHEKVINYIVVLISKTRGHQDLERGGSPRSTLALTAMAKAYAYINGRNYVTPLDVQNVFIPVITHRLILTPEAEVNDKSTVEIANDILKNVPVPKI
jgi:MoxR-like ATPase